MAQKKSSRPNPQALATSTVAKPLVFISASNKDYGWRERLKTKLNSYADQIEWWDDSRGKTGDKWQDEIEAMIESATVAVVLLSPIYLSSETATSELARLERQAQSGGLRLFPIVLEACSWQQFAVLRYVRIWSAGRPIGELTDEETDHELEKIANSIVELATSDGDRSGERERREFLFSDTAEAVLSRAQFFAEESGRAGVTSSCLLFAFADQAGFQTTTTRFVHDLLNRGGGYKAAFDAFLYDSTEAARESASALEGLSVNVSLNTRGVLEYAASIALRVCKGSREIHARHLFAALLVAPETHGPLVARIRLKTLGIDMPALCLEFRQFLRAHASGDTEAAWDAILSPSRSSFVAGTPGYTSEFCGVGGSGQVLDHLGVEALAHRLAELMALRETKLPLAVGLFGHWGSGKSHFMNLMDRHMKKLADETPEDWAHESKEPDAYSRPDPTGEGPWCREIVSIYFNAWHYADTNLWASLVTEIFEGLFAHLQPKHDELALMRSRLQDAGGATARAQEEVTRAHEAVKQAAATLQTAHDDSKGARQAVEGLLDSLRTLVPQVNTEENRQRVTEWLGVSAEFATLSQLVAKRREMASLRGRVRELWRRATARDGRAGRLAWLLGAIIIVQGLAWLSRRYIPQIEAGLRWLGPWVQATLVALTGAVGWMIPVYEQVQRRLRLMESWQEQAEAAQETLPKNQEVIDAQQKVVQAEARAVSAETELSVAQALEQQLKRAVDELRPERRLSQFIEARARSADYRGQLGLVSLARKDFHELSSIFADSEALRHEMSKLSPKDAEKLRKLGASIDRIVLFVDDLDRCQPEKVVDVLQAVHLLLAYPLFGVVVGVDQRCLRQSIRMQFKGLLTSDHENDSAQGNKPGIEKDERPATPLDYLEKIFHVPFHLPVMGEHGFANLIERLTEPPAPPVVPVQKTEQKQEGESPIVHGALEMATTDTNIRDTFTPKAGDESAVAPANASQASARVIGSVSLHRWERDALKDYHALIRTPRAATRLLNTYRLVRAGIPAEEWVSFRGDEVMDGEFRVVMLLLASAAGYPAVAREWFELLRIRDTAELLLSDDLVGTDAAAWRRFKEVYDNTHRQMTVHLTKGLCAKWLDRVEMFAF